jgi:hypothetical protein
MWIIRPTYQPQPQRLIDLKQLIERIPYGFLSFEAYEHEEPYGIAFHPLVHAARRFPELHYVKKMVSHYYEGEWLHDLTAAAAFFGIEYDQAVELFDEATTKADFLKRVMSLIEG